MWCDRTVSPVSTGQFTFKLNTTDFWFERRVSALTPLSYSHIQRPLSLAFLSNITVKTNILDRYVNPSRYELIRHLYNGTPSKAGVNGLLNQKPDNVIPGITRLRLQRCRPWSLYWTNMEHTSSTITRLLAARWTLDEIKFAEYENILGNRLQKPDLHAPFCTIASKLVRDAHSVLGMSGARSVEHFKNGNIKQIYKTKPNLHSLWLFWPPSSAKKSKSCSSSRSRPYRIVLDPLLLSPCLLSLKELLVPKPQRTPPPLSPQKKMAVEWHRSECYPQRFWKDCPFIIKKERTKKSRTPSH